MLLKLASLTFYKCTYTLYGHCMASLIMYIHEDVCVCVCSVVTLTM